MRVLNVNKYYQLTGGGDRYFFDSASILQAKGHQVIPYCLAYPGNIETPYAKYFPSGVAGKELDNESIYSKSKYILNSIYSFESRRALTKMLLEVNVEVAHLHIIHFTMSPSIIDALDEAGVPIVFSLHDYRVGCIGAYLYSEGLPCIRCAEGHYYKAITRRCYRDSVAGSLVAVLGNYLHRMKSTYSKVALFTVPHQEMANHVVELGIPEDKIRIIDNPFFMPDNPFPASDGAYVLYFGLLNRQKGIFTLIEAAKQLPGIPFLICGKGSALGAIKKAIEDENLVNVQVDTQSRWGEGLEQLIAAARVVISPSEWPTPMEYSTLESLALGKATLASRVGGNVCLIEDMVTGCFFSPGDRVDLVEKLTKLYSQPSLCALLGSRAKETIKSRFATDKYYERIISIYNEAIGRKIPN